VDKPGPDGDASEQDESNEGGGELVISGGDARHMRRAWSARARRSPTLRRSSVHGSSSASSLPRGRSRLTASRPIESLDEKNLRNESPDRGYDSFGIRRKVLRFFAFWSGQASSSSPQWTRRCHTAQAAIDRSDARTCLSTRPRTGEVRIMSPLPAMTVIWPRVWSDFT
jgi:hypothetical protein